MASTPDSEDAIARDFQVAQGVAASVAGMVIQEVELVGADPPWRLR
jgi:hypothetical protein